MDQNELARIVDELINTLDETRKLLTNENKKEITYEELRAKLASITAIDDGVYKQDIKALIKRYSPDGYLRSVNEADYASIIKEAEGFANV